MLVLSRRTNERIQIIGPGGLTTLVIVGIQRDKVRLGFEAPREIEIVRDNAKRREPRSGPQIAPMAADRVES